MALALTLGPVLLDRLPQQARVKVEPDRRDVPALLCAKDVARAADLEIGGGEFVVMAGPCAVENEDQYLETARHVAACGGQALRGRASPDEVLSYLRGRHAQGARDVVLSWVAQSRQYKRSTASKIVITMR